MPSLQAYAFSAFANVYFYRTRWASRTALLARLRDEWKSRNAPAVVPSHVASDGLLNVAEEQFEGGNKEDGQRWQVFHMLPTQEAQDTVVIYWHGGAFVAPDTPQHWSACQQVVHAGFPVVLPMYTLAPLATGTQCIAAAIDLVLQVSQDERYAGKRIVFVGDSAGGWIVLRLALALTELALDKDVPEVKEVSDMTRDKINAAREKLLALVLISPLIDCEMLDEDTEKACATDPWLNVGSLRICSKVWCYGPSAIPDFDFGLPATSKTSPTSLPLSDPSLSPVNGIDVLKSYPGLKILQFIGTRDTLYPQNVLLHDRLVALGDAVDAYMTVEPDLLHVYPIISILPESKSAWDKIISVLSSP